MLSLSVKKYPINNLKQSYRFKVTAKISLFYLSHIIYQKLTQNFEGKSKKLLHIIYLKRSL